MGFLSQSKFYIMAGVGILIAIGVWWTLSESPSDEGLLVTENPGGGLVDKELIGTLLQLRAVSLGGTIFSDPSFMRLRDYGTQIISEPAGRANPFTPASAQGATTTGNQLFPTRQ